MGQVSAKFLQGTVDGSLREEFTREDSLGRGVSSSRGGGGWVTCNFSGRYILFAGYSGGER